MTARRDEDFAKFNNRENDIKLMQSQYKQMEMRLESMEKTQEGFEETNRYGSAKRSPYSKFTRFKGDTVDKFKPWRRV